MLHGLNISKSFGDVKVLDSIDVRVNRGEITVLIGPSGGGKSTLLRALSLLDLPDSGKVSIDDFTYNFPLHPDEPFRRPWPDITVVFQQLFLWPHMTLRQNILLPLEERNASKGHARLGELIDLFDMGDFVDRYPNQTSLGQRQRAAFARAVVLEPRYLLLDEITSALDVEHVSAILRMLELLKEEGMGILTITHLIGFARRAADQVSFLDKGRVLEAGGVEVLDSPSNDRLERFLSVIQSAA
jgi:ABC-type polar amino acid transport system ATPase subunit